MKLILSRKGFDSKYGRCPSPILPDGTMLSIPIPTDNCNNGIKYSEITYQNKTYLELINEINSNNNYAYCHLDPDIRKNIRKKAIKEWKAIFGQIHAAETHLEKQNVSEGDLFLFFGYYQKTQVSKNGKIQFCNNIPPVHALFGYLQVGKIVRGEDVKKYNWHPHSDKEHMKGSNNTMYIASDELVIDNEQLKLPGYGVFNYSDDIVLTKPGLSGRSKWKLMSWMNNAQISFHPNAIKDDYFQSARIGQEFVVNDNCEATEWAKQLIINNLNNIE